MIGRCEAWDLVLPDDGGEPTNQRCQRSGRLVLERTGLGHQRQRVVCEVHGLDTAPPESLVPELSTATGATLDELAELYGIRRGEGNR